MSDIEITEFFTFINEHKIVSKNSDYKGKITHTGYGEPWGSFYIEDNDKFLNLYKKVVGKIDLHLIERPKKVGPLVLDFDLKFDTTKPARQYCADDILEVVKRLNTIFLNYINVNDEKLDDEYEIFIFEKDAPTCNEKSKEYKDGFHIVIPIPLNVDMRYFIYDKLKEQLKNDKVFDKLNCKNNIDDICDSSVIFRNGWMMYGSRKKDGKKYELTKIYNKNLEQIDINKYDVDERVVLFSIRRFSGEDEVELNDKINNAEFREEFSGVISNYVKNKKEPIKVKSYMELDAETKISGKFGLIKKLVDILSIRRAENYDEWTRVGWVLHNINPMIYTIFSDFSKKCPNKFNEDSCKKLWDSANDSGLTIASLHWWAKQDNPEEYCKIIRSTINEKISHMETGNHDDIALALKDIYEYEFRCVSMKKNIWYQFINHRWVSVERAYTLQNKIAVDITGELSLLNGICYTEMGNNMGTLSKEEIDKINERIKKISSLINKLKSQDFINKIIERTGARLFDGTFEKKLDCNPDLIGFNNGIYDLKQKCFRDGSPDDMVSFTTGYDYKEFEGTEPIFNEIHNYFCKVQPDKEMREYILRLIASLLDGNIKDQKFSIWTGSGCFKAKTRIMMFDGRIKNVEDIIVGDKLMGDDGTCRTVSELFRGQDLLYKIIPEKGEPYIVNGDHILSLKSKMNYELYWPNNNNKNYNLVLYKQSINGIPEEVIKVFKTNKEVIDYLENTYNYDKIFIHEGDIINISVKNWLMIKDKFVGKFVLFKARSFFTEKKLDIDPYIYGTKIYELGETTGIPYEYLCNSEENQIKLLSGIMSKYQRNKFNFKKIVSDIIFLCRSLGFSCYEHNGYVDVQLNFLELDKTYINKKFGDTNNFNVIETTIDNFYGFEIDRNKRFLLESHDVVHNSNGKSTTISLIEFIFGENYYGILPQTFLTKARGSSSSATPELSCTKGKRILFLQEPEHNDEIHVGIMKEISGGDTLYARSLYGDPFSFKPQFKLILSCNKLPSIPSTDGGTWRRLRVAPWKSEFIEGVPKKPNQFILDKTLSIRMKDWKEAFMWLLINKYYIEYITKGLDEPEEVMEVTKSYKKDSDTFYEFTSDNLLITKDEKDILSLNEIYASFKSWFKESHDGNCAFNRREIEKYFTDVVGLRYEHKKFYGVLIKMDEKMD